MFEATRRLLKRAESVGHFSAGTFEKSLLDGAEQEIISAERIIIEGLIVPLEKLEIAPTISITPAMLAAGEAKQAEFDWQIHDPEYRRAALCATFLAMWRVMRKEEKNVRT